MSIERSFTLVSSNKRALFTYFWRIGTLGALFLIVWLWAVASGVDPEFTWIFAYMGWLLLAIPALVFGWWWIIHGSTEIAVDERFVYVRRHGLNVATIARTERTDVAILGDKPRWWDLVEFWLFLTVPFPSLVVIEDPDSSESNAFSGIRVVAFPQVIEVNDAVPVQSGILPDLEIPDSELRISPSEMWAHVLIWGLVPGAFIALLALEYGIGNGLIVAAVFLVLFLVAQSWWSAMNLRYTFSWRDGLLRIGRGRNEEVLDIASITDVSVALNSFGISFLPVLTSQVLIECDTNKAVLIRIGPLRRKTIAKVSQFWSDFAVAHQIPVFIELDK